MIPMLWDSVHALYNQQKGDISTRRIDQNGSVETDSDVR